MAQRKSWGSRGLQRRVRVDNETHPIFLVCQGLEASQDARLKQDRPAGTWKVFHLGNTGDVTRQVGITHIWSRGCDSDQEAIRGALAEEKHSKVVCWDNHSGRCVDDRLEEGGAAWRTC